VRGLRLVCGPGFACIELMFDARERLLQTSHFFRAEISIHTMLSGSRSWIDSECVIVSGTSCHSTTSLMPMMARWGRGPGYVQFPHKTNPEPRKERPSRIWRKINPQRQAECEVKRDAGCECNGGCIHSLFLIFLCTAVRRRTAQRMELGL
jgi:hypothetical protein